MDNYIAASQEQNMLISVRDDSSSIDFDMVDFENFDELTDSYEDADMEVENERMATYFLPVRTLTAVDNLAITGENIAENHASIWHQPQVEVPQKVRPVKPRGPCKRYTAHQIGKLSNPDVTVLRHAYSGIFGDHLGVRLCLYVPESNANGSCNSMLCNRQTINTPSSVLVPLAFMMVAPLSAPEIMYTRDQRF